MSKVKSVYDDKKFYKRVLFLRKSQFWNKKKLHDYQLSKLKFLFRYVKQKIPFYSNYIEKYKIKEADFKTLEDIKLLPLINKKLIQRNLNLFLPKNINKKKLFQRTTGGSTATPLTVWADYNVKITNAANTQHYMEVFDLDIFKYKSVRLYGDKIKDKLINKNIYWMVKNKKILVLSSYHINRKNVPIYLEAISNHQPKYIHTRASAIYSLSKFILEEKIKITFNLKYIFSDGEYLTKGQRKIIEQVFSCRMINNYGHTESVLVGHPCKFSNSLHFMPQNGILELLDNNGNEIKTIGRKGEMVGTGFNNFIFPLIRYQTGDIAVKGEDKCKCGRNYKILSEVEGRSQDYVIDKKNNIVPLAPAIFNYNDMDWKGIDEFKVIQKNRGQLKILIQPNKYLKSKGRTGLDKVCKKIKEILGPNFLVNGSFVSELKKSPVGKYRYLDQKLKINF